ncbi:Uncharacterised protein [Candidatus Anstonella stagnisolia]|nr:Uncharacterised protein [Candidatus Anstonella stagnisolia]
MQTFLSCVHGAKSALPKSALFAFNFCADAVVKASMGRVLALPFVQRDAKLKKDVFSGVQREVCMVENELARLKKLFPKAKMQVGGQAGFGALTAHSLGVKPTVFTAQKSHFPSLRNLPVHFVFEYCARGGKRSRLIAAHEEKNMIPSSVPKKMHGFSHIFLGGFHLLKTREDMLRAARMLMLLKKRNPDAKIFVEAGEFLEKECISAFRNSILPFADCVGLNEVELHQLTGKKGKAALHILSKKVRKIVFHSPNSAFAFPKEKGDAQALLFAKIVASYAAKYGKRPNLKELGKYAKEARSLYVKKPKYTVGLGDTFSCAYFLVR